jgi:hypothetical protein
MLHVLLIKGRCHPRPRCICMHTYIHMSRAYAGCPSGRRRDAKSVAACRRFRSVRPSAERTESLAHRADRVTFHNAFYRFIFLINFATTASTSDRIRFDEIYSETLNSPRESVRELKVVDSPIHRGINFNSGLGVERFNRAAKPHNIFPPHIKM